MTLMQNVVRVFILSNFTFEEIVLHFFYSNKIHNVHFSFFQWFYHNNFLRIEYFKLFLRKTLGLIKLITLIIYKYLNHIIIIL